MSSALQMLNGNNKVSYLTFKELLFQVISERAERASVIVSKNLEFFPMDRIV